MYNKDSWGLWVARLVRKRRQLVELLSFFHARICAIFWRVELGEDCHFWGRIHFNRVPESKIQVGSKCHFRSAFWSNNIGINRPCLLSTLQPASELIIGEGCGFSGTVISAARSIQIGNGVICGANVTITDTDWHNTDPHTRRGFPAASAPVIIDDNVWLGVNVLVLKGVSIGKDSVIGANSVVTKSIPPSVVAIGQPAKVVKQL